MSALLGGGALLYHLYAQQQQRNECCGIVGYIGSKPLAGKICIDGLSFLESRGYDSCGIVSINEEGKFVCTKFASSSRFGGDCIRRMEKEGPGVHDHYIGIGHTRWATHGDKTDLNAHPHFDSKRRVAIIHNGIIENYAQLREELINDHGVQPETQTDTEIVVQYVGVFLDKGCALKEAISKTVEICTGSFSFVLISTLEPDKMFIAKNTGTMVIGVSNSMKEDASMNRTSAELRQDDDHHFQIVSSDACLFQDYTKHYYMIEDKDLITVSLDQKIEHTRLQTSREDKV